MKICIFTGFFLPHLGGVERYTDKLAKELKNKGYKVIVVCSNDNNYADYEQLENCFIYRLPTYNIVKSKYPILKKTKAFKKIIKMIEEENCDFYICNTRFYLTSILCGKMAKKYNKKMFVIEHGSSHFTVNNKILDFMGAKYEHFLTNRLKKYNPQFFGVSERCNNWLKHFKIIASGIFYNSVDENVYEKYENSKYKRNLKNKIVITYVGRIIKEKGVLLLLDSFTKLQKEYNNITLVIAGDGPLLNEIKSKYTNKNIYFEGKLDYDDVMSLYNSTDIFVNPSMYPEGLPTSILEAGIMKCAIIATDRGGTKEVINDKKYGIIIEENENSLYNALKYLIDNPSKVKSMKNEIYNRVKKHFTWKITAENVIKELNKND